MRYATVVLSWEDGQLHPLDDAVAVVPEIEMEATLFINPVGDGTYVELCQFRGSTDALREVLEETPSVLEFELPEDDDGIVYLRYESTPAFDGLLEAVFDNTVVLQWPVTFVTETEVRGIRATVIGSESALSTALGALPDSVGITLIRTGEYTEAIRDPTVALTDQQHRLLKEAITAGYYDVPRQATQSDLAESLGVSPGTISDRLQRLESTMIKSVSVL